MRQENSKKCQPNHNRGHEKLSNQLEFTIHVQDDSEFEISPSPSVEDLRFPGAEDDDVPTLAEILPDQIPEECGSESSAPSTEDSQISLIELQKALQGEKEEKTPLLQDLAAMKEEAWAKRKARRMRRELKRVQFQDPSPSPAPFQRTCCPSSRVSSSDGDSETSETSYNRLRRQSLSPVEIRPIAQVHCVNMFQNIIPRSLFENQNQRNFRSENTLKKQGTRMPLTKILAQLN